MGTRRAVRVVEARRTGHFRGRVVDRIDDDAVAVELDAEGAVLLACDLVRPSADRVEPGDRVLVVVPEDTPERGCVVGRIGGVRPAAEAGRATAETATLRTATVDRLDRDGLWLNLGAGSEPRRATRYPRWSARRIAELRDRGDRVLASLGAGPDGTLEVLGLPAVVPDRTGHLEAERIVVDGKEEIAIRVGRAAIVLRSDGEIEILGTRIVSRARESHRLLAPMIKLN